MLACKVTPPWSAGTRVKFLVVYPLPWDLQFSAIYQNFPGVPITATYAVNNAIVSPSLGRSISACGANCAPTSSFGNVELISPGRCARIASSRWICDSRGSSGWGAPTCGRASTSRTFSTRAASTPPTAGSVRSGSSRTRFRA